MGCAQVLQDTEPLDRVPGCGRHLLALINDSKWMELQLKLSPSRR